MKTSRYLLAGLLTALTLTTALTSAPASAASFKLEANGNEPFYQSILTKQVYQYTRSDELQDLTISNAAGESVPYALIPYEALHPQTATSQNRKKLILFPIQESSLASPNKLRIQLEKHVGDTTLNVISSETTSKTNSVYLLDAGKEHAPLETLIVDWQGSEGKLLAVDVLTSDDLENWSHAGSAVLLKTATTNNSILQNTITLDHATEARYLQIRPIEPSSTKTFNLTQASAEYSKVQTITPNLLWQSINFTARKQDNKTGQVNIDFESLGRYPASYLRLQLPQDNTITTVTIQIRNSTNEEWSYLTTASAYHLKQKSKTFTSPDIMLTPTVARYWRLQFNQSSGGIGAENPTLSLGWLPPTVVWNARGQAPFTLHVGENPNIVNSVDVASLIPDYKIEKIQQLVKAGIEEEVSANTGAAANSWLTPINYKRWLLWGGLFLGVLLLAGMAYSLLKNDNRP
jgi:hypothetical protein